MKSIMSIALTFLFAINFSIGQIDLLNQNISEDKTLSPYFFVQSDNPEIDQLPLYLTKADVNIVGVIADVTITQIYKNTGKSPLEAIYVFPASTHAAVYSMTMTIGERILKAEIQEREKARETYEKAKKEGKSASLLEQQRPNVFQMNVANIMPGDSIIVELKYTELLIPTDKIYEFVYPTVVGPRYSNKSSETTNDKDKFVETPYKHEGEKPDYIFDIKINISTGVPLHELTCGTHKVDVSQVAGNKAFIELDKADEYGGNKDFVLKYSLSGNAIETGLLLSDNGKEKFFLLMLQPPIKIEPKDIPAREYIFIVDVSGSMYGFPLDVSKEIMKNLLSGLKPNEKFNILFFAGSSEMLFEKSMEANNENLNKALTMLEHKQGGGGTELLPALQKVIAYKKEEGFSRTILILTDGYIDVEAETFDLIRNNLKDANVFSFGIGNGVNRFLIEGIARAGQGEPFVVTNQREAKEKADRFFNYVKSPIMTNISVDFGKFDSYDIEPNSIPDVFADRPIIIYGKWRDVADGNIRVSGLYGQKKYHVDVDILKFGTTVNSEALKYLWVRNKIAVLNDYASLVDREKYKPDITELGLKYNLLTEYTSFVAVDYITRNDKGKLVTVKQALPLPEGVSDKSVGQGGMVYSQSVMGSSAQMPSPVHTGGYSAEYGSNAEYSKKAIELLDGSPEDIPIAHDPLFSLEEIQKNLIYPEQARKAGIQGKVVIRCLIEKDGTPTNIQVIYSDNAMLDSAAIKAVMKTKFVPATVGNQPIASWVTIPVVFKLSDKDKGYFEEINQESLFGILRFPLYF